MDAGTYTNDFASVATKISLYAVGGRVTMLATVPPPNQKGILVEETDLHIEGFTFQGTHIPDDWGHNGAGIRVDNGNLSLVNCAFIGNQDGLLTNAGRGISVSIDRSLFDGNGGNDGNGAGNIHAIYVGDVASFTITNSTIENTLVGHEVKSRAEVNTIVNNTIISGAGSGTGSYAIDLPNGGKSVVRNNTIIKGPNAENSNIIHFGGEGIPYAGSSLLVEGNLFSNTRDGAIGVLNHTAIPATIRGNVLDGLPASSLVSGPAKTSGNWDKAFGALQDATLVGVLPGSTMIVADALAHQVTLSGGQIQAVQGGAGRLSLDVWAGHVVVIGGAGGMDVTERTGMTGGNQYTTAAGSVNSLSLLGGRHEPRRQRGHRHHHHGRRQPDRRRERHRHHHGRRGEQHLGHQRHCRDHHRQRRGVPEPGKQRQPGVHHRDAGLLPPGQQRRRGRLGRDEQPAMPCAGP